LNAKNNPQGVVIASDFTKHGRSVKLTDDGLETLERISSADSVMTEQKTFLDAISPRATEAAVERVMRMERLL
jgi:hypothetical protein